MTDMTKTDPNGKGKKAWRKLEIEQLDIPSATQAGTNRIQPGEAFVFYRNS